MRRGGNHHDAPSPPGSSPRRHFVERERKTRRAIAAGERDMLAQHTDESFRADHVRFRNAGGAVVQVLMRSDFFATEAFFCDHGRHLCVPKTSSILIAGPNRLTSATMIALFCLFLALFASP